MIVACHLAGVWKVTSHWHFLRYSSTTMESHFTLNYFSTSRSASPFSTLGLTEMLNIMVGRVIISWALVGFIDGPL